MTKYQSNKIPLENPVWLYDLPDLQEKLLGGIIDFCGGDEDCVLDAVNLSYWNRLITSILISAIVDGRYE